MNFGAFKAVLICISCSIHVPICTAQTNANDAIKEQLAVKQSEVDLLKSQIETLKNAAQFNSVEGKADIGDSVSIEVEVLAQRRLRMVAIHSVVNNVALFLLYCRHLLDRRKVPV